jgi:hypothetical protein
VKSRINKNLFLKLCCASLAALGAVQSAAAEIKIPLQEDAEPPALLSETGIFKGRVSDLTPADSLVPYQIIQPLWVDFAVKQRWVYLPPGQKISFSAADPYGFPVGTVLIKHFRMETSRNVFINIETRLLIKKEGTDNWVGYTYKWQDSDAKLIGITENASVILNIDNSAVGGARNQTFKIPTRAQCLQCHNSSVGFVRSFRTLQLNRLNGAKSAEEKNQLAEFNKLGLFDKDIGDVAKLRAYAGMESEAPLELKVKSYVEVNCSHCHNPDPNALCNFTGLDFRFDYFNAADLVSSGHVIPGSKETSEIFKRMSSVTPFQRMPFIGSVMRDEKALKVLGAWIDGLTH